MRLWMFQDLSVCHGGLFLFLFLFLLFLTIQTFFLFVLVCPYQHPTEPHLSRQMCLFTAVALSRGLILTESGWERPVTVRSSSCKVCVFTYEFNKLLFYGLLCTEAASSFRFPIYKSGCLWSWTQHRSGSVCVLDWAVTHTSPDVSCCRLLMVTGHRVKIKTCCVVSPFEPRDDDVTACRR